MHIYIYMLIYTYSYTYSCSVVLIMYVWVGPSTISCFMPCMQSSYTHVVCERALSLSLSRFK